MTRQEAVTRLSMIFANCDTEMCKGAYACKYCDEAINIAIGALEQEPNWIPVSERLPEIGETVIISGRMKYKHEKEYEYFVDVAFYESWQGFSTFNDWYEGQDEFEIVAWQPLPEPYEESDEE